MKKLLVVALLCMFLCCSCAREFKEFTTAMTYQDPQTLGGYWDVTMQTGQTFNHVKCTYWGTEDDTATFVMDDGTIIIQSGAIVCVRNR